MIRFVGETNWLEGDGVQTQTQDDRLVAEAALGRDWGMLIDWMILPRVDGVTPTATAPSGGRLLVEMTMKSHYLQPHRLVQIMTPAGAQGSSPLDVDHGGRSDLNNSFGVIECSL